MRDDAPTRRTLRRFFLVAALASLAGCAAPGSVVPQQSTASSVRDRVGLPTDIRFGASGEELWEYATGPSGTETWLIRMGKDGRVQEVTQLLSMERFNRIQPGRTTKAEMRDLFGRPSEIRYLYSGLTWAWRVKIGPEWGHYAVRFDDSGIVRERMVLTDPVSDDDKGGGGR